MEKLQRPGGNSAFTLTELLVIIAIIGDSFDGSAEFDHEKLGEGTPADDLLACGNTLTCHQGKANAAFCDGHVESPTLKFLFKDTSDAALERWNRDHLPHEK